MEWRQALGLYAMAFGALTRARGRLCLLRGLKMFLMEVLLTTMGYGNTANGKYSKVMGTVI
ncbi:MAG: hypothetical protein IPJ39_06435 [Saprospiraceae bacterium]|nr:hypothetical protein [Saprospiraceae bacterium]